MTTPTPSDAQPPEWIRVDREDGDHGFWTCAAATETSSKYIRADLFDAERQKREAAERDVEAAEASRAKANERIAEMEAAIAHPTNKMLDAVAKELRETWGTNIDEPKPCPIGWRNTWRAVALPVAQAALTNIEKERDDD